MWERPLCNPFWTGRRRVCLSKVKAAGGWAASLSASVRPVMTYYLLVLYGTAKTAAMVLAYYHGQALTEVLAKSWGSDDMALLTGVINYWMIDRSLAKRGL